MCCQLSRNTSLTTCAAGAHPLQSNYPSAIAYHILLPPVHQDAMMTPQRAFSQPSNLCCLLFIVVDKVCPIVSLKKRAQLSRPGFGEPVDGDFGCCPFGLSSPVMDNLQLIPAESPCFLNKCLSVLQKPVLISVFHKQRLIITI